MTGIMLGHFGMTGIMLGHFGMTDTSHFRMTGIKTILV